MAGSLFHLGMRNQTTNSRQLFRSRRLFLCGNPIAKADSPQGPSQWMKLHWFSFQVDISKKECYHKYRKRQTINGLPLQLLTKK